MRVLDVKANTILGSKANFPVQKVHRWWDTWDGALADSSYVPDGCYKVITRSLRVFGDPKNPNQWDSESTIEFSISFK